MLVRGYRGRSLGVWVAGPGCGDCGVVGGMGRVPAALGVAGVALLGWVRGVLAGGLGWRGTFTGVLHEFRAGNGAPQRRSLGLCRSGRKLSIYRPLPGDQAVRAVNLAVNCTPKHPSPNCHDPTMDWPTWKSGVGGSYDPEGTSVLPESSACAAARIRPRVSSLIPASTACTVPSLPIRMVAGMAPT